MTKTIDDVRAFWEKNPLWTGESRFQAGTKEFFDEHRRVIVQDGFAGRLDEGIFPDEGHKRRVLDLGCGPGFWTVELAKRGCRDLTAADITQKALELARERCAIYGVQATFRLENAEALSFPDGAFSHVNCQGVIHHTPRTEDCVKEIARVLEPGGTASVSVYHRGLLHKAWPLLRHAGKALAFLGGGLKGRGREGIFRQKDVGEIVRLYDGRDNPIGKSYTREEFRRMLAPHFDIEGTSLHFFPARSLPFPLPPFLHGVLDSKAGFLIYAALRKKGSR